VSDTTETQTETPATPTDRLEPLTGSLSASQTQQLAVRRLAELRAAKKELESEEKTITAAIKDEMITSSAAILLGENGVTIARISMFDRTMVDGKKLEALHPAIFEQCSKTNQVIQLRLA
jgi:hypothetical protein